MKSKLSLYAVCCMLAAVLPAQWLETTIYLPDTTPGVLCWNSTDNKVYCANCYGNNVTVIDGATNQVIATAAAGVCPLALCYNPQNNKVYCANQISSDVTVIDGATNGVVATVTAGQNPRALCYRRYVKRRCNIPAL